jgi:dUTP pyrophosphatase
LINHGENDYTVKKHERIAQLIILKTEDILFQVVDELQSTDRATNGFGSTG